MRLENFHQNMADYHDRLLAVYVCGISFIEFRESKRISVRATNMPRGSKPSDKDSPSEEEMSKSMTTY